jgi:competence protein ComEC
MPPLVALAVGSAFGALVYPGVQPPLGAAVVVTAVLFVLAGVTSSVGQRVASRAALLAAGITLGWAGPAKLADPPRLDGEWRLRGRVATAAWGTAADVELTALGRPAAAWVPAEGRVRVRFPDTPPPPGTAVIASGRARPLDVGALPGGPDPAWDAARAAVVSELRAKDVIRVGGPPPTFRLEGAENAGLLRAMLDGERGGVPEEVALSMRRTGTWHLVSISGLHIGLSATVGWGVAWVLTRPLVFVWRRGGLRWLCALAAIGAALAYADVAGWPLPARRAVWMSAAGAILAALRLRPGAAEVLALAWLGTSAADPSAITNPGAQLSFGAMIGMALVGPRVTRWLPPDSPFWVRWPVGALATTAGATVGTLPTVAFYFQDLSVTAPIANLVAVPLMGTVATPALLMSQLLPGFLGRWALVVADGAVTLALVLTEPLAVAPVHPAVTLPGALLLVAAMLLRKQVIAAVLLGTLALGLVERPVRTLVVTILDVGQGDAALVEWPDGRAWLIDGGPPGRDLLLALRRRGVTRLDTVVISHPHPDHIGGLDAVFAEMPVDTVRIPRVPLAGEATYAATLAKTRAKRILGARSRGDPFATALVHPLPGFFADDNVNDESLVLRFGLGRRHFLFAGDVEAAAERAIVGSGLDVRADVLKVPHHGSRTSSSPAFVAAVAPSIAVVPVGRANRYGHPHAAAMAAYRGTKVYRTDLDGSVTIRTDGETLEVTTDPPEPWRLRSRPAPDAPEAVPVLGAEEGV